MGHLSLVAELPWLQPAWERLNAHLVAERLPQGLLITGKPGLGKLRLALTFAQKLLCSEPAEEGCGRCSSCHLFAAQTHPDLLQVEPLEPGKPIAVDQIRQLIDKLTLKPQYGGRRVVIITPAQAMNLAAANSLLKTLEEPDEHTLMLLLTPAPEGLPATILSRCQRLTINPPSRSTALAWLAERSAGEHADTLLALAQGAPLRALDLVGADTIAQRTAFFEAWQSVLTKKQSPLLVADRWQSAKVKHQPVACESLVAWMMSWTQDLIRLRSAPACNTLDNLDVAERLQALSKTLDLLSLYANLDRLLAAQRALAGQVNRSLLLEELLIHGARLIP